jgi:hypothetical protein
MAMARLMELRSLAIWHQNHPLHKLRNPSHNNVKYRTQITKPQPQERHTPQSHRQALSWFSQLTNSPRPLNKLPLHHQSQKSPGLRRRNPTRSATASSYRAVDAQRQGLASWKGRRKASSSPEGPPEEQGPWKPGARWGPRAAMAHSSSLEPPFASAIIAPLIRSHDDHLLFLEPLFSLIDRFVVPSIHILLGRKG